eukprot:TRINITY_DN2119_c0_g1_i8.p1 TRINITY_DN2119_c0_g1~~TRINITY_DN2119_c0_g1_i8.p1  ORF type:complete len:120 (-),score=9.50 TRINITY_DN2119_c0_g1_i8:463-822(-)
MQNQYFQLCAFEQLFGMMRFVVFLLLGEIEEGLVVNQVCQLHCFENFNLIGFKRIVARSVLVNQQGRRLYQSVIIMFGGGPKKARKKVLKELSFNFGLFATMVIVLKATPLVLQQLQSK